MNRMLTTIPVMMCLATLAAGCDAGSIPRESTATGSVSKSARAARDAMLCDPHSGFPVATNDCPDPEPETGWLTASGEQLTLNTFRTLVNDAEGKAYASEHGEDFPFSDDYFDAPDGASHPVRLAPDTVCTGIISVGYGEPLKDHVVRCADLVEVAAGRRVPVALWSTDDTIVQLSELYRP